MSDQFNASRTSSSETSAAEYDADGAGVSLFVKEMGSGPAVVVLHGGPGAHHDYLIPGFDQLADEFRLYFYDQRGGGRSRVSRPGEIVWRDHVADLEALREGWGFERMALAGYSWGGLLALLYAAEHPARARCLVLVDPAGGWGDYQARFRAEFSARSGSEIVTQLRNELERSGLKDRDRAAYRQHRFQLSVAGYFRDPRKARNLTPFQVQAQVQAATWASLTGHGSELRRKAQALRTPTLIVHGRYDPLPLEWAEELAETLQDARLVVMENSGHAPYVEEPEATFAVIRDFLREQLA